MKQFFKNILSDQFGCALKRVPGDQKRYREIYEKCRDFTMVGGDDYRYNLELVDSVRDVPGDVVECGVWRGGMSAGMAMLLGPGRKYYLFDSFEGLPPAKELDGQYAQDWLEIEDKETTHDNCTAGEEFATKIMSQAGVDYKLVKGWFEDTVPNFEGIDQIAVLRLDGDWYDSTMITLNKFFPLVAPGGLILIDDYYYWEGCAKAVHDYLSREKSTARLRARDNFVYIKKEIPDGKRG